MGKINLHELMKKNLKEKELESKLREKEFKEIINEQVQDTYEFLKKGGLIEESIDRLMKLEKREGSFSFRFKTTHRRGGLPHVTYSHTKEVRNKAIDMLIKDRYGYNSLLEYINSIFEPKVLKFDLELEEGAFYMGSFNCETDVFVEYKIKRRGFFQIIKDLSFTNG